MEGWSPKERGVGLWVCRLKARVIKGTFNMNNKDKLKPNFGAILCLMITNAIFYLMGLFETYLIIYILVGDFILMMWLLNVK